MRLKLDRNFNRTEHPEDNNDNFDNEEEHETHDSLEKLPKQSKLDILLYNNGWNDKNEQLIVNIGENCNVYRNLHNKHEQKFTLYNNIISIIIIVFNGSLALTNTFNSNSQCEPNTPINILEKICIYIVTVLSVTNNFLKFEKLTAEHKHTSSLFNEIYHDIQKIMCLYRKDRPNAVKYISNILKKYDSLILSSPSIKSPNTRDDNENDNKIINPSKIDIIVENDNNMLTTLESHKNPTQLNQQHSNLSQISNLYRIDGDLSENDNITIQDITHSKQKTLQLHSIYEMERIFSHDNEN
jgi:hypothetical protein